MIDDNFRKAFLTGTDDTGRHIVTSARTGRTYFVEAIITEKTPSWGSVDPATGNLMHKKGDGKHLGGVKPAQSMITLENGFDKVHELGHGTSPYAKIEELDAQYPDKEAVAA